MWLYGLQEQHGFNFFTGKDVSLEKILGNLINIGLFSSALYVYVFILDSVIPSQLKYKICYLFFFRQPGYSIFSKIKNSKTRWLDPRFTKEDVLNLYADIYKKIDNALNNNNVNGRNDNSKEVKGKMENTSWYRIYSKYRNDEMIFTSNRDYLLCRDLCIMTILILIFYILGCIFILSETPKCKVVIFLALEFIVTDFAFWFRGNRLACNVLSLDISNKLNDSTTTSNNEPDSENTRGNA